MTAVDLVAVRDAAGRTHEPNPLGGRACLACAEPFPCGAARDGEQLQLVKVCRCGFAHQPRERDVPCRRCKRPTTDHHRVCQSCQEKEALLR